MLTVCGKGFGPRSATHRVRVNSCSIMDGVDITATYGPGQSGVCIIVSREDAALLGAELLRLASTRDETPTY